MKRISGLLAVFLAIEAFARIYSSPLLPRTSEVLTHLFRILSDATLLPHLTATLASVAAGFLLAVLLGAPLGALIAVSGVADAIITPVVDFMRPIAGLTIVPILILIFGLGAEYKIFAILWASWPSIVISVADGVRRIDRKIIEAATLDGADKPRMLRYIQAPLALPALMTGARIALTAAWITIVSSEMIAASRGLGYLVIVYSQTFRFSDMYAMVILIAAIGLAANTLLASLQDALEIEGDIHAKNNNSRRRASHDASLVLSKKERRSNQVSKFQGL